MADLKKYRLGIFGFAIIPAAWFLSVLLPADMHLSPVAGLVAMPVGALCMIIAGAQLGKTLPLKLLLVCLAILISILDAWFSIGFSIVLAGGGIA